MDPTTGELETGDAGAQARRALENMCGVLEAAGLTASDVVKVTICLTDMGDFAAVNEVYTGFFTESPPARICYAVSTLPKRVNVEIDCIAWMGGGE